jgi:hypothetical protein
MVRYVGFWKLLTQLSNQSVVERPTQPFSMRSARGFKNRILRTESPGAPTGLHSLFYEITETDSMHSYRLSVIGEEHTSLAEERPHSGRNQSEGPR